MRITALVENQPLDGFEGAHGLSLYVEAGSRRILFDAGPDDTLLRNAEKLGIDLRQVDTAVISHGHYDHGGGLAAFLSLNSRAAVYIQRQAFRLHESRTLPPYRNIGLDPALMQHPQVILLDGDTELDDSLHLFTVADRSLCPSTANSNLYEDGLPDPFQHEQNLLICHEGGNVLLMGCCHAGVVNILKKAKSMQPKVCVGGFHLYSPARGETVSPRLMDEIAAHLRTYEGLRLYTGHCTGQEACDYLRAQVPGIRYFHCGESLEL